MPERSPDEIKLRQFLYTSNEEWYYTAGDPENYNYFEPDKLTSIEAILNSEHPGKFIDVITEVDKELLTPRRENLLYALAVSLLYSITKSNTLRHDLYSTISGIIKNDYELFLFIKYMTKVKKSFSSGLNKMIANYYLKKNPRALAEDIAKCGGYHGWTHKDLIKLSHCKSENILVKIVFTYVLFGFNKCKEIATESNETKDLMKYLSKVEEFKKAKDDTSTATLLKQLKMPVTKIPPNFHKSSVVWSAAINNMTLQEIVASLTKFYKLGLLKQDTATCNKIVQLLSDVEGAKKSKISPLEVYIATKNFEKGGKPKDPKLKSYIQNLASGKQVDDTPNEIPKCPTIMNALHKTLLHSYQNLRSMDKRFLIAIDCTSKMNELCLHNKNITCYEAAAIIVTTLLKSEKQVIICCFGKQGVVQIPAEKGVSVGILIKKFKEHETEERSYPSMMNWAINKKKQIDVFYLINYFLPNLVKSTKQKNLIHSLQKYQTAMGIQAKLIRHSLAIYRPAPDEISNNSLQICGFDTAVLRIIEGYSKSLF